MAEKLMQGRNAAIAARRSLNGVQTANQIEGINDKKMKRHSDSGSPQAAFLMGYLMIS
jgi:hypothetical protein